MKDNFDQRIRTLKVHEHRVQIAEFSTDQPDAFVEWWQTIPKIWFLFYESADDVWFRFTEEWPI